MEEKKRRRWGDRKTGRRLRTISPYMAMTAFIMKDRNDASNYFMDSLDVTEIDRFLHKKRSEGMKGLGLLHLFTAAYVRTVSQRPAINRYVSGQQVFHRNNIELVMTIKKEMSSTGDETSFKAVFEPTDTLEDIYNKINIEVDKIKNETELNSTDTIAAALMKLPRVVLRFAVSFLKLLDYFGWLPKSIIDASPFHGSLIITDLGSLGIPPIYHHLYNFGNLPVFLALGAKRFVNELNTDGTVVTKKYIDYTVVSDERICDGFYFAQSFKYMKNYLRHPEQLCVPPEQVFEDID